MNLEFFDEIPKPRSSPNRASTRKIAEVLKANPGKWAKIRSYAGTKGQRQSAYTYAAHCKAGRISSLSPQEGIEVVARAAEDGLSVTVFARYSG